MRRLIAVLICASISASLSPLAHAMPKPRKSPKPFVYEGSHLTPGAAFVTFMEHLSSNFTGRCGSPPASNGTSSTFVELPPAFFNVPSVASATGGGTGAGGGLRLSFWDRNCGLIQNGVAGAGGIPSGTLFVEVSGYFDVNVNFKLTVKPIKGKG